MRLTRMVSLWLALTGAGAALWLAGCGGGSDGVTTPAQTNISVSGTVSAPQGTTVAKAEHPRTQWFAWLIGTEAYALSGNTPVPNATVIAYRFDTGVELARGTTDANGRYSLNVPDGLDVLIVAETATLRLSKVLADVSNSNNAADVTASTTIAAEVFGAVHYKQNTDIAPQDIGLVENVAAQQLANVDQLNLALGGGVVSGEFGGGVQAPAGLENALQAIQQQVPAKPSGDVAKAKKLIQAVRDSGTSLKNAAESELLAQENVIRQEVIPSFGDLGERLGFVSRILFEDLVVVPAIRQAGMLMTYNPIDLPSGTYQEQAAAHPWFGPFELARTGDAPNSNQVVINAAASDTYANGMTITITRTGELGAQAAGTVAFQVTSTEDPSLDYHGTATSTLSGGNITQATLEASFQDQQITTPLTVAGTLTGTPVTKSEPTPYSQITFSGTLNSAKVKANVGTWTVNFSGSVPQGAPADAFWAQYPSSFVVENASIETVGTTDTMKLTGGLNVTFGTAQETVRARKGRAQQTVMVPTAFTFTGTYAGKTVTSFAGTLSATWTDPSLDVTGIPAGTATVQGTVKVSGQPDASVDLSATSNGTDKVTVDIEITRGTVTLTGTATATFDSNGAFTQGSLALTNEEGLKLTVTVTNGGDSVSGTITTAGGTKVADLVIDPDLGTVTINYTDGTFETF